MVVQAEWMAPEVLRNEPADEKYGFVSYAHQNSSMFPF